MLRPAPITTDPTCPYCGNKLTLGWLALACGPKGTSTRIPLPDFCTDRECQRARDEAAIEQAIARGIITR